MTAEHAVYIGTIPSSALRGSDVIVGDEAHVEVMLTVWADGVAQLATRHNKWETWGAPTDLERLPLGVE